MTSFVHDLRHSLRLLAKSPAFALVAILIIALGIGANTAIFSVVDAVLLRPLPYPGADRLVVLSELAPNRAGRMSVALPNLYDWQAQTRLYDGFSAYRAQTFILTGVDTPDSLPGREVSSGFLHVLGVQPVLGRNFTPADDQPDAPGVAILSYGAWKSRFGADPGVIGRKLKLNSEPVSVAGVLPSNFQFGSRRDEVFIPLSRMAVNRTALDRGNHMGLFALARLKPGVSLTQADAEIKTIARRLEQQYPLSNTGNSAQATSLYELWVGNVRQTLLLLLAAVGFVLLIACANVANLLLARSAARQRELAIRAALGAGSWRIARQLLTESLLLSCLGGALGLMLARWVISGLHSLLPVNVPRLKDVGVDLWVLGFALAASVATGVVFGLAPALQARRTDFNEALKASGRAATMDGRRHRLRRLLLVTEIALALVLSVGAGLMTRSAMRARAVDPGFDPRNLLTMFVSLPGAQYRENARQVAFFEQALDRMRVLPGVRSASLSVCLPIDGSCWGSVFVIEGRPLPKRSELWQSQWNIAGKDYFETMRIRLMRGRTFRASDVAGSTSVAVINETAARKFFPGENPIGRRVRQGWPEWTPLAGDRRRSGRCQAGWPGRRSAPRDLSSLRPGAVAGDEHDFENRNRAWLARFSGSWNLPRS